MRLISWFIGVHRRIMERIVGPLGAVQPLEAGLGDETGAATFGYVALDQKRAIRGFFIMFAAIIATAVLVGVAFGVAQLL